MRRVSSGVGSVSDQLKAHARVGGVSGLLFAALLVVALPVVKQSRGLAEPENVYANFYNKGILLSRLDCVHECVAPLSSSHDSGDIIMRTACT